MKEKIRYLLEGFSFGCAVILFYGSQKLVNQAFNNAYVSLAFFGGLGFLISCYYIDKIKEEK